MRTFIQKFRFCLAAGLLALFMLAVSVSQSAAQQEPKEPFIQDVASIDGRNAPAGADGLGCYQVQVISCPLGLERVHCNFTGVYGPPYNCTWTSCLINWGERHCVKG